MAFDWSNKDVINRVTKRITRFVCWLLPLDRARAEGIAIESISFLWEQSIAGKYLIIDEGDLRRLAGDKAHALAGKEMRPSRNHLSYSEPDGERRLDKWSYARCTTADQIAVIYTNEVKAGIARLPTKQREVMELLCNGLNAADIAITLRLPIHTCFSRIRQARQLLMLQDLTAADFDKGSLS